MRLALSAVVCLALMAGSATAQTETKSALLVKQLVSAMNVRQLDAIAAPDPDEPGRFVAALAFPEVQLLVVSSRHRAADYITLQIGKKQFREVYGMLQDSTASTRFVVHDMGCDGIVIGGSPDIVYDGAEKTMLDGKWLEQSITEAAYREKQKDADEKYSRVLTILLDAVKKIPVPTIQ
jgi:hypothetical protein